MIANSTGTATGYQRPPPRRLLFGAMCALLVILLASVWAGLAWLAISHEPPETVATKARIVATWTHHGGFMRHSQDWTLYELPDGTRVKQGGIHGVAGETVTIWVPKED